MTSFTVDDPRLQFRFDALANAYVPPSQAQDDPDFADALGAAFAQDNWITGLFVNDFGLFGDYDPDFDAFEVLDPDRAMDPIANPYRWLRGYEIEARRFRYVRSLRDVERLKSQLFMETKVREELATAPGAWYARIIAGTLDPLIGVPAGKVTKLLRGGISIRRGAAAGAIVTGGFATAQEAILQAQQQARPIEESATFVTGAVLLGGILGGAAGFMSARQLVRAERDLDGIIKAMAKPTGVDPVAPNSIKNIPPGAGVQEFTNAVTGGTTVRGPRWLMRAFRKISPRLQNYVSESPTTVSVANRLHQSNVSIKGRKSFDAETALQLERAHVRNIMGQVQDLWIQHRTGNPRARRSLRNRAVSLIPDQSKLSRQEFMAETSKAMRGQAGPSGRNINVDTHPITQVEAAAKLLRKEVINRYRDWGIEMGLLPKEVADFEGYLTRLFNKEKLRRPGEVDNFVEAVTSYWAKESLRTGAAFDARAVAAETRAAAESMLATPLVRGSAGDALFSRPFLERLMRVPDEVITPWLSDNAEALALYYTRAMASDLAIAERFGLVRFRAQLQGSRESVVSAIRRAEKPKQRTKILKTRDDSVTGKLDSQRLNRAFSSGRPNLAERIAGADTDAAAVKLLEDRDAELMRTWSGGNMNLALDEVRTWYGRQLKELKGRDPKRAVKLRREFKRDLRNLRIMRDDLRGTLNIPEDTTATLDRVAKGARQLTYMATGGGVAIAAIPDMSLAIMQYGLLRVFRQPFMTLVRNLNEFKMSVKEAKLAREPVELISDSSAVRFFDMEDEMVPRTRFERGLQKTTHAFSIWNLMAPWNKGVRGMAAYYTQGFVVESAQLVARGGRLSRTDLIRLNDIGLDEAALRRIFDQWDEFGGIGQKKSIHAPNTTKWTDARAVRDMRAAITRMDDEILIKSGPGDRPVIPGLSQEMTRLLFLYRGFGLASMTRVLLKSVQYADARSLSALLASVGLGMLAAKLRELTRGVERERSARQWVGVGFERSAFSGIIFDADRLVEAAAQGKGSLSTLLGTRGELRYFSPRDTWSAVFGPVAGQASDLIAGLASSADLDPDPADVTRLRRLIPFQNAYGWRLLFDEIEQGARAEVED